MTIEQTKASLLLYLETCAVDYGGRMNSARMNDEERRILAKWVKSRFVKSGRIVFADCNKDGDMWVHLSSLAWHAAQKGRMARAFRTWENKRYARTDEERASV